ncbi:MAG: IucA/IucC family siderophore biosynthesis protein [Vulcanimicrobiota bacterium]
MKLSSEEQQRLEYLQANDPTLAPIFLEQLPGAHADTLKRLAGSLLREGFAGEPLAGLSDCRLGAVTIEQVEGFALGRNRILGRIRAGGRELTTPLELIASVRTNQPGLQWDQLALELENGAANLALARAFWQRRAHGLADLGCSDYFELVERLAQDPGFDRALFSETLCIEGHNLHPCAKTRLDLDPRALMEGSAELEGRPTIGLFSADPGRVEWAGIEPPRQLLEEVLGPLPGGDRWPLPVHRWQQQTVLPSLAADLEVGDLRLEDWQREVRSTASFRTLAVSAGYRLKLSVSSQMTSTQRCISPQTTLNGPAVSRLLNGLRCELGADFVPLAELAGLHYRPHQASPRLLNCIVREGTDPKLAPGEIPIACCSLTSQAPTGSGSLLEQAVARHGRGPVAFMADYAQLIVPPHLTLLCGFGLALEAHLQNCIVAFDQGRPSRLLALDWGGIRAFAPRLSARGLALPLAPGSVTISPTLEAARDKLFYCLYQAHLGEIVLHLAERFELDETLLWAEVHQVSARHLARLERDPRCRAWVRTDREALYAPRLKHKALTRMRLAPAADYHYVPVTNPLFRQAR